MITAVICAAAELYGVSAEQYPYPLHAIYNQARAGDKIVKQELEYKDAGRAGENVVWDFSVQESVNDEYLLYYETRVTDIDTVLAGTEHYTMYSYKLTDSISELAGYENPVNKVKYLKPLLKDIYPLNYGDKHKRSYELTGTYSQKKDFSAKGETTIEADAYGIMLLPDGETLKNVLRVKTLLSIINLDTVLSDTSYVESYRWFAAGFRYPVFEILRSYNIDSTGEESNIYQTAFYYPPPQDEFFETADTANENLLAKIKEQEIIQENIDANNPNNLWVGMTYNVYPNPVHGDLNFELYLPKPVNNLHIQVHTPMGIVVIDRNAGSFSQGLHRFTFNTHNLRPNTYYVLDFWLDGYFVQGSVILKK
jgi:hypothetical protein